LSPFYGSHLTTISEPARNSSVYITVAFFHLSSRYPQEQLVPQTNQIRGARRIFNLTMCIALISTAHPTYPLILIDNRDVCLSPLIPQTTPRSFQMLIIAPRSFSIDPRRRQTGGQMNSHMFWALAIWLVKCTARGWALPSRVGSPFLQTTEKTRARL
jgi:hypothetical protein